MRLWYLYSYIDNVFQTNHTLNGLPTDWFTCTTYASATLQWKISWNFKRKGDEVVLDNFLVYEKKKKNITEKSSVFPEIIKTPSEPLAGVASSWKRKEGFR